MTRTHRHDLQIRRCLLTALPCEARPLLDHFRLRSLAEVPGFRCYARDDVLLVVSGIGRTAAAAAVATVEARYPEQDKVWLNLGIAGHRSLALGTLLWVGKAQEAAGGRSWYPPPVPGLDLPAAHLLTVDRPHKDYPADALVDMEAAGFFDAGLRFRSIELLQSLKVVSDNAGGGFDDIDSKRVETLIRPHVPVAQTILEQLAAMAASLAPDPAFQQLLQQGQAQWRFSSYQRKRLARLLQRWWLLGGRELPSTQQCASADEVLHWLQASADAAPFDLGPES